LEATRKEYSQPQLKEMMALEEQLAKLQEEIKQSESQNDAFGDIQEKSKKLESRLERLASRDKKLAEALKQDAKDFQGWSVLGDDPRLRKVTQALQTRIQEEILESSVMDADPMVPSAYKELVEKYFKALSDDLR
jgi:predicted RNase H-like nuclease (RuvC/YqgF family)